MKRFLLLSLCLSASPIFAKTLTCEDRLTRVAAFVVAGGDAKAALSLNTSVTVMSRAKASLYYRVTVFEQVSDGTSSADLPPSYFDFVVDGTESACRIRTMRAL